jgi:hypothetical protein
MVRLLALNGRAGRLPSCLLGGVKLPRRLLMAVAAHAPRQSQRERRSVALALDASRFAILPSKRVISERTPACGIAPL